MTGPTWRDRLAHAFWYFLLPAGLSVALVQGLANARVLEEAAPWQFLLAFAVFEVLVLTVRDQLAARNAGSRDLHAITTDAIELKAETRRLLKKASPSDAVKSEFDDAIARVDDAVSKRKGAEAIEEIKRLDALVEKHLGAVRKGTTREYAEAIGFAVLVALGIRAFVVEAFKIPSPSMYPTLNVGDNIFVNKFVYGPLVPFTNRRIFTGRMPRRGEVVVFVSPADPSKDFIKRVVGLPGDRIFVQPDGSVLVNNRPIARCEAGTWSGDEGDGRRPGTPGEPQRLFVEWQGEHPYLTLQTHAAGEIIERRERTFGVREPYTVPEGHVFVMGDNRDNSSDSRYWGPVPLNNIKGKALFIWWSNAPGAASGMRWSRFGQDILGPPPVPAEMREGYDACIRRGRDAWSRTIAAPEPVASAPPAPSALPSAPGASDVRPGSDPLLPPGDAARPRGDGSLSDELPAD